MRNLLALVAFVVISVAAVGWYLGWYHVDRGAATEDGHRTVSIDINQRKIASDVRKGEKKIEQAIDNHSASQSAPTPAGSTTVPDDEPRSDSQPIPPD